MRPNLTYCTLTSQGHNIGAIHVITKHQIWNPGQQSPHTEREISSNSAYQRIRKTALQGGKAIRENAIAHSSVQHPEPLGLREAESSQSQSHVGVMLRDRRTNYSSLLRDSVSDPPNSPVFLSLPITSQSL
jgi:hypothetical protein